MNRLNKASLAVAVSGVLAGVAQGATYTWNGAASGGTWDTSATNWNTTGSPWASGQTHFAIFNTASLSATVSGTVYANQITASDNATLTGGTIASSAANGLNLVAGAGKTFKIGSDITPAVAFSITAATPASGGTVEVTGGTTTFAGSATNFSVNAGATLLQSGGTINANVNGGNTFRLLVDTTGATSGGTFRITSGTTAISTANFLLGANASGTSNTVGSTNLATVTIDGANAILASTTNVDFGFIQLAGNKAGGTINLNQGEFRTNAVQKRTASTDITANFNLGSATGTATIRPQSNNMAFGSATAGANFALTLTGSNGTFNSSDSGGTARTLTVNTAIGETGGAQNLAIDGTTGGIVVFNAANTYTGATTLKGGTLQVLNASALAGGGNVTFSGGVLQHTSTNTSDLAARIKSSTSAIQIDTNNQTVTYAGAIDSSNTGGLTKSGLGTLSLTNANTFTGTASVTAGTLTIGNVSALAGAILSTSGGGTISLGVAGTNTYNIGGLTGSNNLNYGANSLSVGANNASTTFSGALSGSGTFSKVGSGTLTFSSTTNSHTNSTQVGNGTLAAGSATPLGSSSLLVLQTLGTAPNQTSGTFDLNGFDVSLPAGISSSSNGTTVALGSKTLTIGSGNGTNSLGSTITGTGKLVKSGTGTQTLFGNTLNVANTWATDINQGRVINVNNGLGGTGAVSVASAATLAGNGTVAGATTIAGGAFLTPSANNGNANTKGTLAFPRGLTNNGTATLDLISATVNDSDLLSVTGGTFNVGSGSYSVNNAGSITFAANQSWDLFNWTTKSGMLSTTNVTLPTLVSSLRWNTSLLDSQGIVSVNNAYFATLAAGSGGSQTLNVTGSAGSYDFTPVNVAGATTGSVNIVSPAGVTAPQYVLLDLLDPSQASTVASNLDGLYGVGFATVAPQSVLTAYNYKLTGGGSWDLLLTFNTPVPAASLFSWDFTGIGVGGASVGINNIGVIPEPTGLTAIVLASAGMLSRRRRAL